MFFVDFHTHLSIHCDNTIEIVSYHNTKPLENELYSVGFHPWHMMGVISNENLNLLKYTYLNDKNCLAIGECGLDRLHNFSFDRQLETFNQQIKIANELSAPVIIHCVKSFNEIIEFKKEYPSDKWCIHGFLKNKVLAKQLLDHGFYLSIAPYENWIENRKELMSYLPIDRIFIESDGNRDCPLKTRYKILAKAKQIGVDVLILNILDNCKIFFGDKWKYPNG